MIYDFQKAAYDKLLRTAVAHRVASKLDIPIRPRFHRLLIGQSGSGKTYVAREVAKELGWRCLNLNCASWTVIGGKETPTWEAIAEWLLGTPSDECAIIILDEIDKVSGVDSWTRYLRAEVFSLMDGLIPSPSIIPAHCEPQELIDSMKQTLIIGCGAFQDAFETKPTAGFVSTDIYPTSSNDLSKYLQRELINRFDSEIIIFPQLTRGDYISMIEEVKQYLSPELYDAVYNLGISEIDEAIKNRTAARFVENVLSKVLSNMVDDDDIASNKINKYEENKMPIRPPEVLPLIPPGIDLWEEAEKRFHAEAERIEQEEATRRTQADNADGKS